jgi:hypothetical protein
MYGRIHNAPALPSLVRAFNGMWMGAIPHLLEPVWGIGAEVRGAAARRARVNCAAGSPELSIQRCAQQLAPWLPAP